MENSDFILKCSNCNRELVEVVPLNNNSSKYRMRAHCPCGDKSFLKDLSGKFFLQGINCEVKVEYEGDIVNVYCYVQ